MSKNRGRLIVEREDAGKYLLISLIAFATTVIGVRWFLELTGYPQVGNSTLHIAHVLWGGLLLFVAILVALIWDNPSFMVAAAALSGIGMGLFIDEVGKFITQNNDYFFPAAAPIIYGFFLVTVLIYILVRRPPDEDDPRRAMVHALETLQDAIYGELDEEDGTGLPEPIHGGRADTFPVCFFIGHSGLPTVVSGARALKIFPQSQRRPSLWDCCKTNHPGKIPFTL